MGSSKPAGLLLQKSWRRTFQSIAETIAPTDKKSGVIHEKPGSNWKASLELQLNTKVPRESNSVSIYRVPTNMRQVEPEAYDPSIISIGPYHHGVPHLRAMEELKWHYFRRLFIPSRQCGPKLDTLINAAKKLEEEARSCYSETSELSSEKFVEMILVDGCFIVELFREFKKHEFKQGSILIKRWMLPLLRRDLIRLENQLPMSVLSKLFNLTRSTSKDPTPGPSLQELALCFFDPLMPRDPETLKKGISATKGIETVHFLDLFRSSILPRAVTRGKGPHMFRSVTELKEAGIKIRPEVNCQPLELGYDARVLKIPPLYIDDYRGTLFRNMVAFEQCHPACKPDIATYLFFLDGLINSAEDIGLLHYAGVIQHSLGSNKEVAGLVNRLCREVAWDIRNSYLHQVVWKISCYTNDELTKSRTRMKHYYFSNPWASMSTLAAIFLFYISLLQTCWGFMDAQDKLKKDDFWLSLKQSLLEPFSFLSGSAAALVNNDGEFRGHECMFGPPFIGNMLGS